MKERLKAAFRIIISLFWLFLLILILILAGDDLEDL